MNSTKKGPCYGFKLQSLDSLTITKSTDKRQTLVHYLVELVEQRYPDLKNFEAELNYLEKASQFSLENILTDVAELEKGMEITRRELENRLAAAAAKDNRAKVEQNAALKEFVDQAGSTVKQLRNEANKAQELFKDCAEYFGENPKMIDANTFFGYFVRFSAVWKTSGLENEKRKKLAAQQALQEQAQLQAQQQQQQGQQQQPQRSRRNMQAALVNELKNSLSPTHATSNKKAHIKPDEVRDGTLEDLILSMKNEPYRAHTASEGVGRKSFRRQRSHQIAVANGGSSAMSEAL